MTEQQRREICTELARRMGIPESKWPHLCRVEGHALDETYDDALCVQCDMHVCESPRVPPDPFTSAADKDALVEWLAADDARWFLFIRSLVKLLPKPERDEIRDTTFRDLVHDLSLFMAAPRETITLAACKALSILADDVNA